MSEGASLRQALPMSALDEREHRLAWHTGSPQGCSSGFGRSAACAPPTGAPCTGG